ncbi:hypothetical protein ACIO3O_37260 [Streptomyces sp. NPDC087440]|uniref:hypothetical protein n=1 Tax=Streptomyces sp. NPDC087440 TaxID=3365790 RepID=UPI0037F77C3E
MSYVLDLDAARREARYPDGIPVLFGGEDLIFPAELPADALDPLLSDELGLVALLGEVLESSDGDAGVAEVVTALFRRPSLPRKFLTAIRNTYAILLGEQFDTFLQARPSLSDYVRLTVGLSRTYGVELGKHFRSDASSTSDGTTSKPTSPDTTESTPDASGNDPETPTSSV